MLFLNHLTFRYPKSDKDSLSDISLTFRPGESVCVMGANGSGKSTLIKAIAGLLSIDSGMIFITHQRAGGDKDSTDRGQIAVLFQNPDNQMVAVTVEKELAFGLENQAMTFSEMHEKVLDTAQQFGISHLFSRHTSQLSGGEKQRVALASVMITDPAILLLDEPDSFLDIKGREILDEQLRSLRARNPNLIELRITQSLDTARGYSRLVILDAGRVAADGKPEVILNDSEMLKRIGLLADVPNQNIPAPTISFLVKRQNTKITAAKLHHLSFAFLNSPELFSAINFSFETENVTGLRGSTGSGKSTLALLLTGLLKPNTGSVQIHTLTAEKEQTIVDPRIIGMVFQQPEKMFCMSTCRDEVSFGPINLGMTLSYVELRHLFELVGLDYDTLAERDPHTLSAGEKRRLAFISILSMSPQFIIFDEPTSGLDANAIQLFCALSNHLKRIDIGQLIISHDEMFLQNIADKIVDIEAVKRGTQY